MISTTSPKNYFLPEKRAPIEGKIELSIKLKKACPARMTDKIKKYISTNSARTFLSWIKNKRLAFYIEMTITRHNDKNSNLKKKESQSDTKNLFMIQWYAILITKMKASERGYLYWTTFAKRLDFDRRTRENELDSQVSAVVFVHIGIDSDLKVLVTTSDYYWWKALLGSMRSQQLAVMFVCLFLTHYCIWVMIRSLQITWNHI